MTGTSMDGLDMAVCRVAAGSPERFELVAQGEAPFPPELRRALLPQGAMTAAETARANHALGRWYAEALAELCMSQGLELDLVGMHGQTVYHEHGATTLQLGEPGYLAERLGCPVVHDFRSNDIVVGGCGAPLVPIFDRWMLAGLGEGAVALNLGGISNITAVLPRGDGIPLAIVGFDCGPGNMILDELAQRATAGAADHDHDGRLAAAGRVREEWVQAMFEHPFFDQPPPRSAGREQFGAQFVDELIARLGPADQSGWCDLLASATDFTARAVAEAIGLWVLPVGPVAQVVASGGGVRNPVLLRRLAAALKPVRVTTSDELGVPSDLKEAIAFALLASARVDEIPANLPEVTGASRPVLLGRIAEV
jgi:anhydro-N-acetylmuramic acid kinase